MTTRNRIKCIQVVHNAPWDNNTRLQECEKWLNKNVGSRWEDWDWAHGYYGVVDIYANTEMALLFKLQFGVA